MKRQNNKLRLLGLIALFVAGLGFVSCEKVIDLPLNTSEIRLVIEGNINNLDSLQQVRITTTKKYFSTNVFEGVPDAFVELTEMQANGTITIDTLQVTDKDGECSGCFGGFYQSKKITYGKPGSFYKIRVQHNNKTHFASTYLNEVVNIDSLTYVYKPSDPPITKAGYYISMYAQEPDTVGNAYRIRVFKNDTLYIGEDVPDYQVSTDTRPVNFNGLYIKSELPYYFKEKDKATIELISTEEIMYRYYQVLARQVFAGGNPFAPPGDNLITNIKGDPAFGFFGSFAISRKILEIKKK